MAKRIDIGTKKYPGFFVVVDDEDFDRLLRYKWSVDYRKGKPYAIRGFRKDGKHSTIRMHAEILGGAPGMEVDHIDGDGLNNQKSNLRLVTPRQNQMNRKQGRGTSAYKGVDRLPKTGKFKASIVVNGKKRHIGHFDTEEQAALAYNAAAAANFGEFASLNEVRHG